MEHTNAAIRFVKKRKFFYMSTNALMHEPNKELYVFDVCSNCETVFLINPVLPEILKDYYTENYLPYRGSLAWGKYFSL
jgi:hypothetical protein